MYVYEFNGVFKTGSKHVSALTLEGAAPDTSGREIAPWVTDAVVAATDAAGAVTGIAAAGGATETGGTTPAACARDEPGTSMDREP